MNKATEHLIRVSISASEFDRSMRSQMVDPHNPEEAIREYNRIGPMRDQNGHEFKYSDLFVLRAWREIGTWNIVKLTPELAEAFAQTDPPTDGLFDERGHAIAIEVGELTHLTAYLGSNPGEILGFTGGADRSRMDAESHQRLVRNVHYVLSEHRRASSFDGLEVTSRVPSAKANKKRGRKYYPGVEFVIGSTTTIHLDEHESQERSGGSRDGWTLSKRTQVRGFWRHQAHGPSPPLACHEGCSNCCNQRVRASVPEVLAVAAYIRANFEPGAIANIVEQLPHRSPGWHGDRCALLIDARCSIYDVRPLVCQGHNGINPADCHRIDHVVWLPQDHNFKAASEAIAAALGRADIRREMVEFAPALRLALIEIDAERRYFDGNDVFAASRLP